MKNEFFDQYVEEFKKLPLQKKQKLTIDEIKKVLAVIEEIKFKRNKSNTNFLFNKEILDLSDDNTSYDDFVEGVFVYMHSIQESLAEYFDYIIDEEEI